MKYHVGIEDVNGIVIGPITWPYEFWTKEAEIPLADGRKVQRFLGRGHFGSDAEAETYARERWPEEYASGIEMRVFDQERYA